MKAIVNQDACIRCGACTAICPDVFVYDDEKDVIVAKEVTEANKALAVEASEGCPTSAISVEE